MNLRQFKKICIKTVILSCIFLQNIQVIAIAKEAKKDTPIENKIYIINDIQIKDAWIRPSRVDNSAAYMIIENVGNALDQLIDAQTDVCKKVELHRIELINGVFHMRPVEFINIPATSSTTLKPAGMHLMLINLKRPMIEGQTIKINLNFKRAGKIVINAKVQDPHKKHISNKSYHDISYYEILNPLPKLLNKSFLLKKNNYL